VASIPQLLDENRARFPPPTIEVDFDYKLYTTIQYNDITEQYQPWNLYLPENFNMRRNVYQNTIAGVVHARLVVGEGDRRVR